MIKTIKKVSIFNLGCKVNQYDCDCFQAFFENNNIIVTSKLEHADLYIINTCAVTSEAERKSRQIISRIRNINADAIIIVTGCASEKNKVFYIEKQVFLVTGTQDKPSIISFLQNLLFNENINKKEQVLKDTFLIYKDIGEGNNNSISGKDHLNNNFMYCSNSSALCIDKNEFKMEEVTSYKKEYPDCSQKDNKLLKEPIYKETNIYPIANRTRALIKIQDGCDNFCSYCVIPYLRGRSRSRNIDNIIKESEYVSKMTDEIVITGINLSAYGKDTGDNLKDVFEKLSNLKSRVRLGSFYAEAIDEDLLETLNAMPNFCPHFHLSLQSGSDKVLKDMNRHYTTKEYAIKVDMIRKFFPKAAITTDIIVGYPTETQEDFEQTIKTIQFIKFSDIHIFPYSSRPGTKASLLTPVDKNTINKRKNILSKVKEQLGNDYLKLLIGVPQDVIFEQQKGDLSYGYSEYYIKIFAKTQSNRATVLPKSLLYDGLYGEVLI